MSYLSKLLLKLESLKAVNPTPTHEEDAVTTTAEAAIITTAKAKATVTPLPSAPVEPCSDLVKGSDDGTHDDIPESSSSTKDGSLCELCTKVPSKYTCPGCGLKTCSLPCIKEHKIRLSCTGERVKTAYVDKSQYSDRHLLNDYRFLENAERSVYSNKVVPKNRRMIGHEYHHHHRPSPYHRQQHNVQYSKRCTILMSAARKRGIYLRIMPDHLEKHKSNTSFYTISTDVIDWHIEWHFVSSNCMVKDEKVPESTVLMEAVKKFGDAADYPHLRKPLEDYRKKFHLCRYLIKVEGLPANRKRYIELYPSLTVGENLKGLCLVEHPTIVVLPPSYNDDDFELLDKDEDLTHMQPGNMRHLTRNHPDFSQESIIQDQILDPSSSVYKPTRDDDDDDDNDAQVISDSDD